MNRRLPVLTAASTPLDRALCGLRRLFMLVLAFAYVALFALLAGEGLSVALDAGDGIVLAGSIAPMPWAALIHVPIMLGYLGFAAVALHPRYRDDTLFRRIGWLTVIGVGLSCARMAAAFLNMAWLVAPLALAALLVLGRALVVLAWWPRPISMARRMVVNLPIGLHAGWLTVLAPLNILSAFPAGAQALSLGGGFLALVGLLAVAIAGVRLTRAEPAFVVAILWGLFAIMARGGVPSLGQPLGLMAILAALVIIAFALWTRTQSRPAHFL